MKIVFSLTCILFFLGIHASAQDTLPNFNVVAKTGNRNVISWTNTLKEVSQISIQRSKDSLKYFLTIMTVPDPMVPQNGFVDGKPGTTKVFYRLFIVKYGGKYEFTKSQRPAPDTGMVTNEPILKDNQRVVLSDSLSNKEVYRLKEKLQSPLPGGVRPEKFFVVKKKDIYRSLSQKNFKKFRDSIVFATRDTMIFESVDTIVIKPFIPAEIYRASRYVYTDKYGNVMVSLPDAGEKKYSINFFEENKKPIFEIEEVTSTSLVVDKTNFVHAGWFWFELYENGKLKEKHRFFIPKEF